MPTIIPSLARDFFDRILTSHDKIRHLRSLVQSNPPTYETEWLDFKGAKELSDKKVKEIWSQALSGFANTQGGVLIWGVDARPDTATEIDAANGFSLVRSPHALKSRLLELHAQATDPPILGVEVESFEDPEESGQGFVVCYVPESPFRPHRAESAGRQFYLRAGDDFFVASVSLLRNLFHPQNRAILRPAILAAGGEADSPFLFTFSCYITNQGTATGADAFVVLEHDKHLSAVPSGNADWHVGTGNNPYYVEGQKPVHPGIRSRFLSLGFPIETPAAQGIRFRIKIFAQDSEPTDWTVEFNTQEIKAGNYKLAMPVDPTQLLPTEGS